MWKIEKLRRIVETLTDADDIELAISEIPEDYRQILPKLMDNYRKDLHEAAGVRSDQTIVFEALRTMNVADKLYELVTGKESGPRGIADWPVKHIALYYYYIHGANINRAQLGRDVMGDLNRSGEADAFKVRYNEFVGEGNKEKRLFEKKGSRERQKLLFRIVHVLNRGGYKEATQAAYKEAWELERRNDKRN